MAHLLAINGSYRARGITDQMVDAALAPLRAAGWHTETVALRDVPLEFCLNCRKCMQQPGPEPGQCVQTDAMADLVRRIEAADAYILASPTNFGSVTAIFKRFMERLAVYGYWTWDGSAPSLRKAEQPAKPALLLSSCAAPGIAGRWLYHTRGQLGMTARILGAKPVASVFAGPLVAGAHEVLPERVYYRVARKAARLLRPRARSMRATEHCL